MGKSDPAAFVTLIRHGHAEDQHALGDDARALTGDGRILFRQQAIRLGKHLRLAGIVTSPLVRAVQTAEILAQVLEVEVVTVRRELAYPGASPRALLNLARELGPGWALVGHNPSLADTLAQALAVPASSVRFRKGAAVALVPGSDSGWELGWIAEPGRKLVFEI